MNLILLKPEDRIEPDAPLAGVSDAAPGVASSELRYRLTGPRAQHVREVLGAEPGRELRVGLLEGPLGRGVVQSMGGDDGPDEVVLACEFEAAPPPRPPTDLLLAIPRPASLRKLLPEVAALGVDRLVLMRTWRVAKSYLSARVLEPDNYLPRLEEGLTQARCTRLPRVQIEPRYKPFVQDRLPEIVAGARALVFDPRAEQDICELELDPAQRVVAAIGPEGGFRQYELDELTELGFTPLSAGPRILRVETACIALLAQLDLLRRRAGFFGTPEPRGSLLA